MPFKIKYIYGEIYYIIKKLENIAQLWKKHLIWIFKSTFACYSVLFWTTSSWKCALWTDSERRLRYHTLHKLCKLLMLQLRCSYLGYNKWTLCISDV